MGMITMQVPKPQESECTALAGSMESRRHMTNAQTLLAFCHTMLRDRRKVCMSLYRLYGRTSMHAKRQFRLCI